MIIHRETLRYRAAVTESCFGWPAPLQDADRMRGLPISAHDSGHAGSQII
jgi:hypothetical protein